MVKYLFICERDCPMLPNVPLSQLLTVVGAIMTVTGLWAYTEGNSTLNLVTFFYGVPILLGGFALRAAELKPVPFTIPTSDRVLDLRKRQATAIQTELRTDVTKYRYGQKAHLDAALDKLGLNPTDEERPVIVGLREEDRGGAYTLVMEFSSPLLPYDLWQSKAEKMSKFFGPNIQAEVTAAQTDEPVRIEVALIRTGLGEGA